MDSIRNRTGSPEKQSTPSTSGRVSPVRKMRQPVTSSARRNQRMMSRSKGSGKSKAQNKNQATSSPAESQNQAASGPAEPQNQAAYRSVVLSLPCEVQGRYKIYVNNKCGSLRVAFCSPDSGVGPKSAPNGASEAHVSEPKMEP